MNTLRLVSLLGFGMAAAACSVEQDSSSPANTLLVADGAAVAAGALTWTNASCTPLPGASKFHVEVNGLLAGEVAEFSLDRATWTRANSGNAGLDVNLIGDSLQYFHARRVGDRSNGIEGALAACAGPVTPPIAYTPRYVGRWAQLGTTPTASYPGASIVADFDGTSLAVDLSESGAEYIDVIVDGGAPRTVRLNPGSSRVSLASLLAYGHHQVRVLRRNEGKFGSFSVRGYDLAGGRFSAPAIPAGSRYLQFVGDSNTAGYGNSGTACGDAPEFQNFSASYAAKLATAFGAEEDTAAVSGMGVSRNMVASDPVTMVARYDRNLESVAAPAAGAEDPSGFRASAVRQAGLVYIQLGQNDFDSWQWTTAPSDASLASAMGQLVDKVRAAQPGATIVVGISPGLTDAGNAWAPRAS